MCKSASMSPELFSCYQMLIKEINTDYNIYWSVNFVDATSDFHNVYEKAINYHENQNAEWWRERFCDSYL